MKQILLLIAFCLTTSMAFSQAQRMVLVEEFTQASCPPCEESTPQLNATLIANEGQVVQIRYQTDWPGVDPMNADNPADVQTRVDYYGVLGVPNLLIDGAEADATAVFPVLVTQSNIDDRLAVTTPIEMKLSHSVDAATRSVTVTASITNVSDAAFAAGPKLRVAVVEELISWPEPPGSTSIRDFEFVMKSFLTTAAGMDMPEIAAGETFEMTWTDEALPDAIYNFNSIGIVGWVQTDNDQAVHQSAVSHAYGIPGLTDLSVLFNGEPDSDNLCDLAFSGLEAVVVNNTDVPAEGYTVDLFINGTVAQSQTSMDEIPASGAVMVPFDAFELAAGANNMVLEVSTNTADASSFNNFSTPNTFNKVNNSSVPSFKNDFESASLGDAAPGTLIEAPDLNFNFQVVDIATIQTVWADSPNNAVGGFGESDNAIFVNFFQWQTGVVTPNEGTMIIADQLNVPEAGVVLSFDKAYTSWGGSNDALLVEVSTDCGESFTTAWQQSGTQLATAPEINQDAQIFVPNASQWDHVEVVLDAYIGQEILIRMVAVNGWGDALYLDNINVFSPTNTDDLIDESLIAVSPNPTRDFVNIELDIQAAEFVSLSLVNNLGQMVKSENFVNQNGFLSHKMNVTDLENGVYFLNIRIDDKYSNQKISIID